MLYIMRHGITDWNIERKMQGKTDIPLNEAGRALARETKEKYKDISFDICFCSPMKRARETAEIFLEGRDVEIIYDNRLEEMGFGSFEGLKDVTKLPDSPIKKFFKSPEEYVAVNGAESFDELFARTGEILNQVILPLVNEGKDVLIVGHGAMNSAIISQVRGYSLSEFWNEKIENCKLIKLL